MSPLLRRSGNIIFDVLHESEGLRYKSHVENGQFSMSRDDSESLLYTYRVGPYQLIYSRRLAVPLRGKTGPAL